jgi:hypothetical protein
VPRGKTAKVGDTRIAPNGYHYTRTENGWRLTHHIRAEQYIGRPLRENERVEFVTKDRLDFSEGNLHVTLQGRGSLRRRLAQLEARIAELTAERDEVRTRLLQ